jgi:hypothetical protein
MFMCVCCPSHFADAAARRWESTFGESSPVSPRVGPPGQWASGKRARVFSGPKRLAALVMSKTPINVKTGGFRRPEKFFG